MSYLLRSMLFVPSYNEKFLTRAAGSAADAVILDLEDSVPPAKEEEGRQMIRTWLTAGRFAGRQIFMRVNELGTDSLHRDLCLLSCPGITGLMIPKIDGRQDVLAFDALTAEKEREYGLESGSIHFIPLIETAAAILHLEEIAQASDRTIALAFGGEDYLDSIHGVHTEPPRAFDEPRAKIVQTARMCGLVPVDTPYLDLKNEEGFYREEKESAQMGFGGVLLVNPTQIPWANDCFSPSAAEISHARRVVGAVEQNAKNGGSIAVLDGKMIGPPMRKRAEKVVALADLIEKMEESKRG